MAITRITSPAITSVASTAISGTLPAANINDTSIGNITALPAGVGGKVLQVVQTHSDSTSSQSLSDDSTTNISGLNATITPSSTSSKIKITCRWNGEISNLANEALLFGLRRDTTIIGNQSSVGSRASNMQQMASGYAGGQDAASTMDSAVWFYMDSPSSTSAITYHATVIWYAGGTQTLYNNRTVNDNNDENHERATSTIILEEIAG